MKLKEENLLEDVDFRMEHLEKIDELEKVKELVTLPNTELMTTRAVAEYFEVTQEVIRKTVERNKEEIVQNGMSFKKYGEIKEILNGDIMSQLRISKRGANIFTKRAVLNVGMLLRDSDIAKKLRSNILDVYQSSPDEIKTYSIDKEKNMMVNVIYAETKEEQAVALSNLNNYKNQYINRLNKELSRQEPMVRVHNQLVNTQGTSSMITMAKNIGVGEKKMFKFLRELEVLFKEGGENFPYQVYQNKGYFKVKVKTGVDVHGRDCKYHVVRVTGEGTVFISNLTDKYGGANKINSLSMDEIGNFVRETRSKFSE